MRDEIIDEVRVFVIDSTGRKNWVFVRLATSSGIVGWGECYSAPDRDGAVSALAERLGAYLVGRPLNEIRHFRRAAYLDFAIKRGSLEFYCALSGIEAAMWDAYGKSVEEPVYNLLGGPHRDRVRVYANGWSRDLAGDVDDAANLVSRATALVARGFTAMKFDPFHGPWRAHLDSASARSAIENVAAVRDAVGPDVDILIEGHRRFDVGTAKRVASMLEPFDLLWFEEPVSSHDIPGLHDVRSSTTIPLVSGEELYSKLEFRPLIEARAVDILNPDVAACGGILELVEIAAMADAYSQIVAPHNYNSTTLGLAATIAASAVIPNFLITEYFVSFEKLGNEIGIGTLQVEDGYIAIPERPGLGVDLDLAKLEALGHAPLKMRAIGGVSDEL
jgi:galactonate dehydratase